jgi:hypothetical protein
VTCAAQPKRIFKSETKVFRITIRFEETGDPLDLTTLSGSDDIKFTVAKTDGGPTTFQKTKLLGGIVVVTPHTGDNLGKADINIASTDTSSIVAADFRQRYDVILLRSGKRHQIVEPSDFEIVASVTP